MEPVAPVPLSRLVRVELRKLRDTRAGTWLLVTIGLLTAAFLAIVWIVADGPDLTWSTFVDVTATPQGLLLPILGIMAATSEWGQRTALVTFTLEPRRSRVATAKLASALITAAAFVVLALALAAVCTALAGAFVGGAGGWDSTSSGMAGFTVLQLTGVVQGLAFGMLVMNTAGAIVAYFVVPIAWSALVALVGWIGDIAAWTDFVTTSTALQESTVSGDAWLRFAVSVVVWVLLPLALGWLRLLRREVTSA